MAKKKSKAKETKPKKQVESATNKLKPTQELFCQLYISGGEFFGNGVQSYIEAYDVKIKKGTYKAARVQAHRLLTNDNILKRINELLDDMVLNHQFVDKQLGIVITQNADLSSKMRAISEYNKLKQRILEKADSTVTVIIKKV